jgi:DNA-binding XRE family transcriptional regulator
MMMGSTLFERAVNEQSEHIFHDLKIGGKCVSSQADDRYLRGDVAFMLHSMYTTSMSRPKEEPVHNRVEILRIHKGLTRQQLAEAVGVHYQTIGYLERGEYSPSLLLALRIAEVLGHEVESIFSIHPFPPQT